MIIHGSGELFNHVNLFYLFSFIPICLTYAVGTTTDFKTIPGISGHSDVFPLMNRYAHPLEEKKELAEEMTKKAANPDIRFYGLQTTHNRISWTNKHLN